jgi:hypothetical protein
VIDERIASIERGNALNLTESCSEGFAAKEKGVPVARHT